MGPRSTDHSSTDHTVDFLVQRHDGAGWGDISGSGSYTRQSYRDGVVTKIQTPGTEANSGRHSRTVVLASADAALRRRLAASLGRMRWHVQEALGGAEAIALVEASAPEALLLDHWLPDLDVSDVAAQLAELHPSVDVLRLDGDVTDAEARSPWRNELLHAIREAVGISAAELGRIKSEVVEVQPQVNAANLLEPIRVVPVLVEQIIGQSQEMLEMARLIHLVAPRKTTVLIEGETGTGKELVAQALHRLSGRAHKAFVVLNCAAIPEALLEAELFGHTRGAFTGAVAARAGRIEAAQGGTLFLDEIGEMPLALQAKMLRFLECGEIQRVGDNGVQTMDVRVIAATHQHLERRAAEGTFRLDLYHRLAVFPIDVPPLRERKSDLPALIAHFLGSMSERSPRKQLVGEAMEALLAYNWPGNVRELRHVLERAAILAGDSLQIGTEHIRLGGRRRWSAVPGGDAAVPIFP